MHKNARSVRNAPGIARYCLLWFFLSRTTLCTTRNRQIMAATVMFVHQASSRPKDETIFLIDIV